MRQQDSRERVEKRKEVRAIIVFLIIAVVAATLLAYQYFWG